MVVGGQHHTHLLYPWGMSTWYSQNRGLGQNQSQSAILEVKSLAPSRKGTIPIL